MNEKTLNSQAFNKGVLEFIKGHFDKSATYFGKAVEDDPDSILAYVSRGVAFGKLGKFDKALPDFDRAIELDPHHPKAYHLRGLVRLLMGECAEAVQDFDKAIEIDPNYGAAYYSRGTTHAELGNEDQAGKDMTMAARLGKANLQAFSDRHNIWRTTYDKVEAEVVGDRERDWGATPDLTSWL